MRTESPRHLGHGEPQKWDVSGVMLDESITHAGPIDLAALFGNARPVEVEIGCGKGTFMLERAAARPEVNFLGIEWARAYALYCADRFRRHGLANVRMLHTDAAPFFRKCIGDASLWRVHIYFPDPWPKARHNRRRLIQRSFLAQLRRVLKPGGQVLVVTDHTGYFEQIRHVFDRAEGFAIVPFPQMADAAGEVVGTNFERKYIAQGRPFHKLARMKY